MFDASEDEHAFLVRKDFLSHAEGRPGQDID